jgi:HK97 family phage prohead protease
VPLLFGHDTRSVGAVIGLVQPDDIWADTRGLWIRGWLDTGDQLGQRLYRLVQKGVLSWSVGFSLARNQRGRDGANELVEVKELYEISATPLPANPRTATAGMKSTDPEHVPSLDELRSFERELGLDPEAGRLRKEMRDQILRHLNGANGTDGEEKTLTSAALKAKAMAIAREHAPIRVESFSC